MKQLILVTLMILAATCAHALYFDIAPASGYSEPLSSGDVIEISATTQPSPGHSYATSSFRLFYDTTLIGEVVIAGWPFSIDGSGFITGSTALDVGTYDAANDVELHVATTVPTYPMFHWYSNNRLEVLATAPMTPTTGLAGLLLLLLAIPTVMLWRR